ncbi:MAG: hypothetical protein QM796_17605 [Chthoniobacteraceae bacterium]
MPSTTYNTIKSAILNKQQVVATYNGHVREMCPHVIGTKNGREQALFYQFGGTSSSGAIVPNSPQNWRCIPIEGLTKVSVRSGVWETGTNHSRPQTCVDDIDVEVSV